MKFVIAFLLSFVSVFSSFAETSVWKVSSGGNVLYLGGTVHLLRESDYPLPPAFEEAFKASSIIVFESESNPELVFSEEMQGLAEEADWLVALANDSQTIQRYTELVVELSALTEHKVYGIIVSGQAAALEQLSPEEFEVLGKIVSLVNEIQSMSGDEEIKRYLEAVQRYQAKTENNKEFQEFVDVYYNPELAPLEAIVDADTYNTIKMLCEKYDFPFSQLTDLTPYWASSSLQYHILGRFCKAEGVDSFFAKKAAEHGKQVEYLDTDDVLAVISGSGNEYGNSYYEYLFSDLEDEEQIKLDFENMVRAWENGYNSSYLMAADEYQQEHFPSVYNAIVKNRNNAWMPIIENYLKISSGVFVLVGNGHMHGPDGLLTQLEAKGYRIEQQ